MASTRGVVPVHLTIGAGVLAIGIVLAFGASRFPAETGFTILGAHVYPYAVAIFLVAVGALLSIQAFTGGFRSLSEEGDEAPRVLEGGKGGAIWITAGLIGISLLITKIGFVLSAALLFTCAARGFGSRRPVRDLAIGTALTLPVYWLFTTGLGVHLPHLVNAWI